MKIVYEYSHLGGGEILHVRYANILEEIYAVIHGVAAEKIKVSLEKNKMNRLLYSPINMNNQFREAFHQRGYTELRDTYTIRLLGSPVEIANAYKSVDFCKDQVLIEVQFGKYPFMFYDLAKFQYFFNENKAQVGVEIVPCHQLHRHMSSGVSYGEQLVFDIERLKRHFPAVPVKVILIDADKEQASI
ncbi:MAG: BglII/BstYI family type II restriction endonuclease [Chloroflexota bacterium]|jgi:hypothetical protein